jgi:hypothetical protein
MPGSQNRRGGALSKDTVQHPDFVTNGTYKNRTCHVRTSGAGNSSPALEMQMRADGEQEGNKNSVVIKGFDRSGWLGSPCDEADRPKPKPKARKATGESSSSPPPAPGAMPPWARSRPGPAAASSRRPQHVDKAAQVKRPARGRQVGERAIERLLLLLDGGKLQNSSTAPEPRLRCVTAFRPSTRRSSPAS